MAAMLVALPTASIASPLSSQATETYVAIGSPAEVETIDSTTGAEVGSAVALSYTPVAMAEYSPTGSADSQVLVAESSGTNYWVNDVDPLTGARSAVSLAASPTAIAVADHSTIKAYGLVLEPSGDDVQVIDAKVFSVLGSVTLGLGTTASGLSFNPDGEYAYVTDATTHQVVTLGYTATSPFFQVVSTYTGSSSFDPTSVTVSNAGTTAYVSDGAKVDVSTLSSGVFAAPATSISLSYTAGTSSISANDATLYVQGSSSLDVAYITTATSVVTYWLPGVTAGPLALTIDGGTLAVASASSSALELMSTITGSVENTASLDGTPVAVTPAAPVSLDLEAFVTEKTNASVAMVDLTTGVLDQTVPVGNDPDAVAVSPNGQFAFVANYADNTISVMQTDLMDTTSGVVVATVSLPSGSDPVAVAVSPDGDRVLVVDQGTGEISVIDSNPNLSGYLGTPTTIYLDGSGTSSSTLLPDAIALSPDGTYAYVADGGTATVSVVSLSTPDTYGWQANFPSLGFSGEPEGLVVAPNDQSLYVTDAPGSGNGYLRTFPINPNNGDPHSGTSVTVTQGPSGVALSPNGTTAYVTDGTSGQVSVVNTAANTVASPLTDATTPSGVAVTADASRFVTSSHGTTSQLLIWSATAAPPAVLDTISLSGDTPMGIAISPMFNDSSDGPLTNYEGDVNPSVAATSSIDVEDGVDTATGGYDLNLDDLSLPDIGIGLDLSQEYASTNDAVNGPLGYGWSFSYGMSLTQAAYVTGPPVSGCNITVTQENGTPVTFFLQPKLLTGGSCATTGYEAPSWEQASIAYVASCYSGNPCWDMTRDGTTQYLFSVSTGDLMFEKDLNGNLVTLAYTSGELSTVTGESGVRQLSFNWTSGNITSVTDSSGSGTNVRKAAFTYSGGGNLTSVTLTAPSTGDTLSHEWAFTSNSAHGITDWWSPDNEAAYSANTAEATQVTYSSSKVTKVIDPDWLTSCTGGSGTCAPTTTFSYPSYDATTDTGTVMISDANENYDTASSVNDGNGNVTLDRYVGGVLVGQAQGYGYENETSSPYTDYPMTSAITTSVTDPFTWLPAESLDADGNLTTTSYDASGNTLASTDPMGRTTSYVYNRFNEVLQETDPLGYTTSSTYDSDGNQLTSTDADGNLTSYAYSSNGEQCGMLSPDGYAALDTLTTCPSGISAYVTAYGYDAEGDQTSVTAYDGPTGTATAAYVTTSLYNGAGELCASLTADGYAVGDRLPASCPSSGAAYETASTAFDVFGNVLSSISPTNSGGGTTTTAYDASGNALTVTDPAGDVTTTTYDPDDQLCWTEPLSVVSPACGSPPTGTGTETTTDAYDPDGNEISSVAPDGNVTTSVACLYETTSSFDNLGRTLIETTPTGGTTCANETVSPSSSTYDPAGNVLTSTDGSGITTTSAYDADSELCWSDVATLTSALCASPPTGSGTVTTTYAYNADGQQIETIPPVGNATGTPPDYATTTTYDPDGNTLTQTVPPPSGSGAGETTTTTYDADGNVLSVTDPDPGTTDNVYDEQNRLLSTTDPDGHATTYSYDADATMLTETQPSSSAGTYTYNGGGQLIEISYTDSTPTVSYQYGSNGQRCWMYQGSSTNACGSPPSGATTYSYDSSSRLTSTTNAAGATVTYGYDASSNIACVSYPNTSGNTCTSPGSGAGIVSYTYNQTNQLTSLTDWAGDTLTFTYNANGQQCWVSTYAPATPSCASPPHQSGAVTTSDAYDALGNASDETTTTGTGPTNLLDLSVGPRNASEQITTEIPTVGATAEATDSYGYNQTDQVGSGPVVGSGSTSYAYTSRGGIKDDTASFQSARYNSAGALCWTYASTSSNACASPPIGATIYTTNSDGERTAVTPGSGNPASYGWETDSNRLVCANTNGSSCSTSSPTATTTVYTYDGNGFRTSATINSVTTNFTWGAAAGSSALLSDGTWDYVYVDGSAAPVEQVAATGASPAADLLLSDESGNVRGLVQLTSGTHQDQLVNYTDYDAYGNPITASGGSAETGGITTAQTGINANFVGSTPWGFGEGYVDPTGLVYLINRYYDPVTAQFMSVDPELRKTMQPYSYASDNPVDLADPDGNITVCANPTSSTELLPSRCGIWKNSYTAVTGNLHTKITSPKFVNLHYGVSSSWVYGPAYDYMSQHKTTGVSLVKQLVIMLHLVQDNFYHNWTYDSWYNSHWTGAVSQYTELCGGTFADCLPSPTEGEQPDPCSGGGTCSDGTVYWLLWENQQEGNPNWDVDDLGAIEDTGDFLEYFGAIADLL